MAFHSWDAVEVTVVSAVSLGCFREVLTETPTSTRKKKKTWFPGVVPFNQSSFDDYLMIKSPLKPIKSLLSLLLTGNSSMFSFQKIECPWTFHLRAGPADRHQVPQPSSQTHGLSEEMYNVFGTFCILLETRVDFNNFK